MLAGVSVTLMTLPIQLWFYYEVPTYSILLNLLVLPFMSLVVTAGLTAMLIPGLGVVGTVDCVILAAYEKLCNFFAGLPFSVWNPGRPGVWQMVVYYFMLMILILGRKWHGRNGYEANEHGTDRHVRNGHGRNGHEASGHGTDRHVRNRHVRSGQEASRQEANGHGASRQETSRHGTKWHEINRQLVMLAVMLAVLGIRLPKETTVTFLDVGQGDCICVQTAAGGVYIFDCGSTSRSKVGEYVLKPYLKYYGIRQIDAVFVSHADADHCNGVQELLQAAGDWGICVEQLVLPDVEDERYEKDFEELQQAAESAENPIAVTRIKAGDTWEDGVSFLCLHPPKGYDAEDANAYSQCFYICLEDGTSLLLTGDVEGEGEKILLEELQSRDITEVTILKVAHHGSAYSTGEEFLKQVQPRLAIISCGRNNSYGHPSAETIARIEAAGSEIFYTMESGAIRIKAVKGGDSTDVEVRGWIFPN